MFVGFKFWLIASNVKGSADSITSTLVLSRYIFCRHLYDERQPSPRWRLNSDCKVGKNATKHFVECGYDSGSLSPETCMCVNNKIWHRSTTQEHKENRRKHILWTQTRSSPHYRSNISTISTHYIILLPPSSLRQSPKLHFHFSIINFTRGSILVETDG